jgi:hypothetical protein
LTLSGRISAGRMIVLRVAADRTEDAELVGDTLAAAGIERNDRDILVLVRWFGPLGAEPLCTLRSVLPLARPARRLLR